ncbi:hypothetical protein M662_17665 [Bacillus sp. SB49]|uniref:hypothetical protein n=1 Tax=Bacillaceae TaxID=186817 RepID=UPI0002A502DC|nr:MULTISPECIES: hypothetical protein [Bacillaceae]ELK48974.1 hypothetical protein D479_00030 [Halobacillus sp. BAB-2008]QHT48232.1 hypothetical protein M662_17665 [Bacillus sp. SB49]
MRGYKIAKDKERRGICVSNDCGEVIGEIYKTSKRGLEKENNFLFSFRSQEVSFGIQKGRILFAAYRYSISGMEFIFKDNPLKSLLYFCVEGEVRGDAVKLEENWNKEIEVKTKKKELAVIRPFTWKTGADLSVSEDVTEDSFLFPLIVLTYFLYKVYKDETAFIDGLIEWV